MAKIMDVDFKNKKLNFTFEEEGEIESDQKKKAICEAVRCHLIDTLNLITVIAEDDDQYHKYCARTFNNIIYNLRGR